LYVIPDLEIDASMSVFVDVGLASNVPQTVQNKRNHSVYDEDDDMHTVVAAAAAAAAVVAADDDDGADVAAAESGEGKTDTQKMKRKLMKMMKWK
jgi:intracellular sulfur oxidation DsrE/DsrF family protein